MLRNLATWAAPWVLTAALPPEASAQAPTSPPSAGTGDAGAPPHPPLPDPEKWPGPPGNPPPPPIKVPPPPKPPVPPPVAPTHNPPAPVMPMNPPPPPALPGSVALSGQGPVVALEVTRDDIPARVTRDAGQIGRVWALLQAAEWTPGGGLPRSRPDLWLRLVPASGEGGTTILVHGDTTYGHVPHQGVFRLEPDVGGRLEAAAWPAVAPEPGGIVPQDIVNSIDALMVRVARPGTAGAPAVVLHGERMRLEPPARDAQGRPLEVHHRLTVAQAQAVAWRLAREGFYARAQRFHTPTVETPTAAPPPDSLPTPTPLPVSAGGEITVGAAAPPWARSWHSARGDALFRHDLRTLLEVSEIGAAHADLRALMPPPE